MIRGDQIYVRTISATAISSGVGTARRDWQYLESAIADYQQRQRRFGGL
jgi:hypothetical protein